MSKIETYKCDLCGHESLKSMGGLSMNVTHNNHCLINKHAAEPAANMHMCRDCANNIAEDINELLYTHIPLHARAGPGWRTEKPTTPP